MRPIEAFEQPVLITRPLLPSLEDMTRMVKQVWESNYLTNNGEMARRLEKELASYLNVKYLSLFSNGTAALQIACKILRLSGQVITTPFTFAATIHALNWCGLEPVFCDIEEESMNMDVNRVEELITEKTTAIVPVHVFGTPCNVDGIQRVADKYGLKVIYDAAHAFGVQINGEPIGGFGDISMFSFHATKVYHTIEGGALVYKNLYSKERGDMLRNFGIKSEECIVEPGTNAKLNEVQAAVGLLLLELLDKEIAGRKEITCLYRKLLEGIPGIVFAGDKEGVTHNYSYFVVKILPEEFGLSRDTLYEKLKEYNIFTRKYFYPLCSQYRCYRNYPSASRENLPVASRIVEEVLSLPLHGRMANEDVEKICSIIKYIRESKA